MTTGVQFTGTVAANTSHRWFTWGWPVGQHVVWYMMPTSVAAGAPAIDWDVAVERANGTQCTYWITVINLTGAPVNFEARYAILS
jgi:hypothetical protein